MSLPPSAPAARDVRPYASYLLPPGMQPAGLQQRLEVCWRTLLGQPATVHRTYLDTFDWRVSRAGGVLLAKQTEQVLGLVWEDRDKAKPEASCRVTALPRWSDDIPPGSLRERVARAVEMRALLPLARVRSRSGLLRVLNADDKTVVRLLFEQAEVLSDKGRVIGSLAPRLLLVPVKGYGKPASRLARFLTEELGLGRVESSRLQEALRVLGRRPGDYSSKLDLRLDPAMSADTALRYILGQLLDTLAANVAGARDDIDSEFLHDLRVATRRTRSALGQVKGVLQPAVEADFRRRFGWLGEVTGPTRDLDVFLLDFPRYRQSLPAALRADLDPLLPYLREHQRAAQQRLRRQLASPHFHRLLKEWREYLEHPPADQSPGADAAVPIRDLAGRRLWRMYRRVLREGRAISADSPAQDLHALRKSCKQLRYLLEFFASLYPRQHIKPLVKQLKRLLDNLGEFQDLQVQAERLRAIGEDLQRQSDQQLPVVLAVGTLIGDLLRRQADARAAFAGRFAAFDDQAQHDCCRAMFKRGEVPQ